jgi:hypothetical protein
MYWIQGNDEDVHKLMDDEHYFVRISGTRERAEHIKDVLNYNLDSTSNAIMGWMRTIIRRHRAGESIDQALYAAEALLQDMNLPDIQEE